MKLQEGIPTILSGKGYRFVGDSQWRTANDRILPSDLSRDIEIREKEIMVSESKLKDAFDFVVSLREPGKSDRSKIFKEFSERLGF